MLALLDGVDAQERVRTYVNLAYLCGWIVVHVHACVLVCVFSAGLVGGGVVLIGGLGSVS